MSAQFSATLWRMPIRQPPLLILVAFGDVREPVIATAQAEPSREPPRHKSDRPVCSVGSDESRFTMSSIAVCFDGPPAFSWTGNEAEVAGVLGAWREIAVKQGSVPEEFAIETVWFWDTAEFMANRRDQQAWMLGAVYFILSMDAPDRAGKNRGLCAPLGFRDRYSPRRYRD